MRIEGEKFRAGKIILKEQGWQYLWQVNLINHKDKQTLTIIEWLYITQFFISYSYVGKEPKYLLSYTWIQRYLTYYIKHKRPRNHHFNYVIMTIIAYKIYIFKMDIQTFRKGWESCCAFYLEPNCFRDHHANSINPN